MKFYLGLFLALVFTSANAQYKMKYGKIDDADLKMTTYEADPEAGAVVLGENMSVIFGFRAGNPNLVYYYHVRIKILDKKAFDQGDIKIPYWSYRRGEAINKIKAQTWNLENGKAVSTEVGKDDIFVEEKNKYISLKKFAFPNVKEGSVLELYYEKYSEYITSIEDYYVQRDIPIIWSRYNVKVLDIFKYRYDIQGKHRPKIEQQGTTTMAAAENMLGKEYEWVFENVPAIKSEPFVTSMEDYYTAVKMRLARVEPKNSSYRTFIGSWPQMNSLYYREIAEKNQLKNNYSDATWRVAKTAISEVKDTLEQVRVLYDFVQKNIKWNKLKEIDPENDADKCFSEGEGSNSEINLTFLSLLIKAGIEAYPMLISTRDNGKPMNFLPYLYQFNQTLVVVVVGDKTYFIDASHKNYPMDILHPNNLNTEGWIIISEDEGRWLPIPPSYNSDILLSVLTLDETGQTKGTIQHVRKGYFAQNIRSVIEDKGEKEYLQAVFFKHLPNANIENVKLEGLAYDTESLKGEMEFECSDLAQVAGEMIYVSPFVKPTFFENPFKTENREIPVDMAYGFNEQYVLKLTIPEGMTVEELPKAAKVALPNNGGSFTYSCSVNGQQISIVTKVRLDQTYYNVLEYPLLREFVDMIINKEQEQIVLKKL